MLPLRLTLLLADNSLRRWTQDSGLLPSARARQIWRSGNWISCTVQWVGPAAKVTLSVEGRSREGRSCVGQCVQRSTFRRGGCRQIARSCCHPGGRARTTMRADICMIHTW